MFWSASVKVGKGVGLVKGRVISYFGEALMNAWVKPLLLSMVYLLAF